MSECIYIKALRYSILILTFEFDIIGGNAAAVIAQKLLEDKQPQPKLQVLIYPKTQMVDFKTASITRYSNKSWIGHSGIIKGPQYISWYLGVNELNPGYEAFVEALKTNQHWSLISDKKILGEYKSYLDNNKIPSQYKNGLSYYEDYRKEKDSIYPTSKLDEANILIRDSNLNGLAKKLFNRDVSPLLADAKYLTGLPKAYFIVFEWDDLKDEGLLYAERLKEANVNVIVKFYEKAFHGMAGLVNKLIGYQLARDIQKDLIDYLKLNL